MLSLNDEGQIGVYGADGKRRSRTSDRYGGYPLRVTEEDLFGSRVTMNSEDYADMTSPRSISADMRAAFRGVPPRRWALFRNPPDLRRESLE